MNHLDIENVLPDASKRGLRESGFSVEQTNAITADLLSANAIIGAKNQDRLHEIPYSDLRQDSELLAAYERLDDFDASNQLVDVVNLMRRTKLRSAVLLRTVHVGEQLDLTEINEYLAPHDYEHFAKHSEKPELLHKPPEPLRIKHLRNLGSVGVDSFVVKSSIGKLTKASGVSVMQRQTFAGIHGARLSDLKHVLGLQDKDARDTRNAIIVPVSTAFIAHR